MDDSRDDVRRLSGIRSALDPKKREWRQDVLISSIAELVESHGAMTESDILRALNGMWKVNCLNATLVRDAIGVATEAHILETVLDGTDTKWRLTPSAAAEVRQDQAWADLIIKNFEKELGERLRESDVSFKDGRLPALASQLTAAIAAGVSGTSKIVAGSSNPRLLRPVRFDLHGAQEHLRRNIQPRPLANAMKAVLLEVIDLEDDFGNELLRLLLTGDILRGLVARRDLAARPPVEDVRLLIDTTSLLDMLDEATPEADLMHQVIDESRALGVTLVVAPHILEEWEGLWAAAEAELAGKSKAQIRLSSRMPHLINNPVLRVFLRRLEEDPQLTWARFQVGRRDPRVPLEARGISFIDDAARDAGDSTLIERVYDRLLELSKDPKTPAKRTPPAAWTDAQSCALLRKWRRRKLEGVPAAWLLSTDTLTGRAYKDATRRDPYPLSITPETWLLFLSAYRASEDATLRDMAEALTNVAARRALLAVATSYTLSEAAEITSLMSKDEALNPADLRLAAQAEVIGVFRDGRLTPRAKRQKAIELVRHRSARRDERAWRERRLADEIRDEARDEVARANAAAEESIRHAQDKLREAEDERDRAMKSRTQARRFAGSAVCLVTIAALLVVVRAAGLLAWVPVGIGAALLLASIARVVPFVRNPDKPLSTVLLPLVSSAAWTVVGSLIAWMMR